MTWCDVIITTTSVTWLPRHLTCGATSSDTWLPCHHLPHHLPCQHPSHLYKRRGKLIHDGQLRHRFWALGWVQWALDKSMTA
jgi:hypothetical protein